MFHGASRVPPYRSQVIRRPSPPLAVPAAQVTSIFNMKCMWEVSYTDSNVHRALRYWRTTTSDPDGLIERSLGFLIEFAIARMLEANSYFFNDLGIPTDGFSVNSDLYFLHLMKSIILHGTLCRTFFKRRIAFFIGRREYMLVAMILQASFAPLKSIIHGYEN